MGKDLDSQKGSPSIDLEPCVASLINAIEKGMQREVAPHAVTPLEFQLLRICQESDKEVTATHLARFLPVDPARISRLVTSLVDKGMLRRRRLREDRRIIMLRLSDEGKALTLKISRNMAAYSNKLTKGIDGHEMQIFASVASRIAANYAAMQPENQ